MSPSGSSPRRRTATTSSSWSPRWATPPTSCSTWPARSPTTRPAASSTCCSPPASGSRWRCWPSPSPRTATRRGRSPARRPASSPRAATARPGSSTSRPGRLRAALDEGSIVIVAGFQGVSQDTKDITTLGRGGSDTTAVAVAAALQADVCEIYTDVDGVFTADPRIVPNAKRLDTITYEEMLELAASGAKVLMLRCVEYARRYGIPVHVRSSYSQLPGTIVAGSMEDLPVEQAIITGVAHDRSEGKITVYGVPGPAGRGGADLPRPRRRRDQHRHDRAERVGRGQQARRHLLHAAR